MRAALYLRRSTNEKMQADSLKVQEHILREYARAHGMMVVAVLSDSASGSTSVRRPGFMRLVKLVTSKPGFEVILVRDVSRFGRFFDVDEGAYWDVLFRAHGVRTIYCEEAFGESESLMGTLTKSIRRVMASEYVRDRSRMVRYSQSRVVRLGFMHGGPPPFGMQRMMTSADGGTLQALGRGEWKALSNRRTKLAPGAPEEIAVVRRIFAEYAHAGRTIEAIAWALNEEGVPSPAGRRWSITTVREIVRNPRYAGHVRYGPRRKKGVETLSDEVLSALDSESVNAHEAIINPSTWTAAQLRRSNATRHRSNDDLASELRNAFEKAGHLSPSLPAGFERPCSWATFANRFSRGPVGALELAYADVLDERRQRLEDLLHNGGIEFHHESHELVVSRRNTTISLRLAFPTSTKHGIRDRFDSNPAADATVFVLMRSDGLLPGWFFFVNDGGCPRGRLLNPGSRRYESHRVEDDALVQRISRLRHRDHDRAERMFLEAARRQARLNLAALARELDWSYVAVTRCYGSLRERGEWMPPRLKTAGRRIHVVCTGCGDIRSLVPSDALLLKSHICLTCTRGRVVLRSRDGHDLSDRAVSHQR